MKVVRPISVSTSVEAPPSEVFEFLAVLANHEPFLDHFLVDWEFSGPPRGVGAKARARQNAPGGQDRTEFEVIEVDDGRRIVEDGLGAKDKHGTHKRHTRGTYTLTETSGGGTEVEFELEWLRGLPRRTDDPADDPGLHAPQHRQGDAPPEEAARRRLSRSEASTRAARRVRFMPRSRAAAAAPSQSVSRSAGRLDPGVAQGGDVLEGEQLLALADQRLAQFRAPLADRVVEQRLEVAVRAQELGGCLRADALRARRPSEGSPRRAMKSGTWPGSMP